MKKLALLTSVLLILSVSMIKAQTSKGKFLVGISSTLSATGTGSNLMSVGYSTTQYKSDAKGFQESDPDKSTSFNLAPKVGYFVMNNLALGLDISMAISNSEYNSSSTKSTSNTTLISVGPFVRYYIPTGKVLPFFELGGSLGTMNSKYTNGISSYNSEYKASILALGGGLGLAAALGDKAAFDVIVDYNSITVKNKKDNPDNERSIMGTFGLKLGFTLLLGGN